MTPERVVDGRRVRGERARLALLEATLKVIEREGVAGVTHRNVTREAGLPATSAAYHFASIIDLLEAALLFADEKSSMAMTQIAGSDDPIGDLARWLVSDFTNERQRCIAEYELFLYAARTPSLRPAACRWLTDLNALVSGWTHSETKARTVCAYVDGLVIQSLVSGQSPDPQTVEATIRGLL